MTSDSDPVIAGPPISLGTTTVATIGPRGTQLASPPQNWTAAIPNGVAGSQTWRIFVIIDQAGSQKELHEWKGGAPCPSGDLDPEPPPGTVINGVMVDPMTGKASTLACAQNNQGFGTVTVSPADASTPSDLGNTTVLGLAAQRAPAGKAGVRFHGAGLVTGNPDHLQLSAGEIPTVKLGQQLTGITYGTSDRASTEIQPVIVYDGPTAAKNVIAVTSMAGVDRTHYGRAEFSWRPKTPGLHTITTRLLGTPTAGDDDQQTFQVLVQAPTPPPTTPPTSRPTHPTTPPTSRPTLPTTPPTSRPTLPTTPPTSRPTHPTTSSPAAAAPQLSNTGGGPLGWLITLGAALIALGTITALTTRRCRPPQRTHRRPSRS